MDDRTRRRMLRKTKKNALLSEDITNQIDLKDTSPEGSPQDDIYQYSEDEYEIMEHGPPSRTKTSPRGRTSKRDSQYSTSKTQSLSKSEKVDRLVARLRKDVEGRHPRERPAVVVHSSTVRDDAPTTATTINKRKNTHDRRRSTLQYPSFVEFSMVSQPLAAPHFSASSGEHVVSVIKYSEADYVWTPLSEVLQGSPDPQLLIHFFGEPSTSVLDVEHLWRAVVHRIGSLFIIDNKEELRKTEQQCKTLLNTIGYMIQTSPIARETFLTFAYHMETSGSV